MFNAWSAVVVSTRFDGEVDRHLVVAALSSVEPHCLLLVPKVVSTCVDRHADHRSVAAASVSIWLTLNHLYEQGQVDKLR